LDDERRSLNLAPRQGGTSEPLRKGDWATLEARSDDGQAAYQNAGMNINYILGGHDTAFSQRSSGALSFAQPARRTSHASQLMAFGWDRNGWYFSQTSQGVGLGIRNAEGFLVVQERESGWFDQASEWKCSGIDSESE
jgi:hypothetical protein